MKFVFLLLAVVLVQASSASAAVRCQVRKIGGPVLSETVFPSGVEKEQTILRQDNRLITFIAIEKTDVLKIISASLTDKRDAMMAAGRKEVMMADAKNDYFSYCVIDE